MKRVFALFLAGCFLLLALAACGSNKADGGVGSTTGESVSVSDEMVSLTVDPSRKQIRNASLTIETKTYDSALAVLQKQAADCHGYLESSDAHEGGYSRNYRSAQLVLRIPAEKLDAFLSAAGEIGSVVDQAIETEDVTAEYVDVESRLNALKAEQEALTELLKAASSLSDILDIRDRLAEVTGELESFQAQLNLLDSQIAYSTVTIFLEEVELEQGNGQGFWSEIGTRFVNNLAKLGKILRGLAIWLLSDFPFLLLFPGIVALIVCIVLAIRRRHKRRTPPKA